MSEQEQSLMLALYLADLTYQKVCVERTISVLHHTRVRDICKQQGNYKQNLYYLEKWTRKGWYSYGVTLDLGWLTEEGVRYLDSMFSPSRKEGKP